jgi:murein DD-endopeptidase MepM/ murein hydrolase activator NlpD
MKMSIRILLILLLIVIGLAAYYLFSHRGNSGRSLRLNEWFRDPQSHPEWAIQSGQRCADAPFLLPTDGMIGFLWGDSFRPSNQHQGIDIFGTTSIGKTPVVAVADGYLTRQADWKSSVIIRVPGDPLQPGRQIWTYYTHMADEAGNSFISALFPPGTKEVVVKAGTLLGYQGNYSGDANHTVGMHLHFSIVKDDGSGHYLNELVIKNTLDPSPYFNLALNASQNKGTVPVCPDKE